MRRRPWHSGVPGVAALLVAAALLAAVLRSGGDPLPGPNRPEPAPPSELLVLARPGAVPPVIPEPDRDLAVALEAPRRCGDDRTLSEWALTASDARVRIASLRRLVGIDPLAARKLLLAVLDDRKEKQKVRAEAARLLAFTGEDAVPLVREILASERPVRVRAGAAAGLVAFGPVAGAAGEIERILADSSPKLHEAVIGSIVETRTEWANALARELVARTTLSPTNRSRLAGALGARRVTGARFPLGRIVADPEESLSLRNAAAVALSALGDAAALPVLEAGLENAPPALRPGLVVAIQRIRRQVASGR